MWKVKRRRQCIKKIATLFLTFISLNFFSIAFAKTENVFSDVHVGLKSYVPLQFFIKQKLIKGYSDGTFRPDEPITRAEAITFIMKAVIDFDEFGIPLPAEKNQQKATKQYFTDVPLDHWAAKILERAVEKKLANGYDDNTFRSNNPINLAEALKMLLQGEKSKNSHLSFETPSQNLFSDIEGQEWYAVYFKEADDRNILRYGFKKMVYPDQLVTRGYFIDLTYRIIKSRDPKVFFGKGTFYSDFFEGRGTSNGEIFTQNGFTAAHKTLPFNTIIRVTNLKNGQHVDVRINDRGPFTVSLDLDLTSKAFSVIAATSEGIVPIQYEIIEP